ncbi:phosphoadenosine phosphosulfate reductase [Rhodoferax sp.]|uniref:phosphoadenosine phosphosulfate reductase n=1 Tax=Rhodoferax sp. TaxID=50421 RepID=UPI002762181F|nr:phosphoadenosine phosphosulfate reductase [Rhodoferax sp.]
MSNGVCEIVKEACGHDQALLSFSCGKDSWAAWLSARDYFDFQPYYLYLVPGLEFVEEYLVYAERVLGKRIVRLPHPSFYRMLNHAIFQAPERLRIILAADLGEPDYEDMRDAVIEDCNLPDNCWVASGVRAADSPMRRAALMKNGGVNANRRQFYPCWDWNKAKLLVELEKANIKLPIDYKVFGRSFDGLDLRFLIKIREHFPRDYATICEWFPLVDMEFARYEFNQRKKSQPAVV